VIVLGMADVLRKIKQAEQDAEKQLANAQAEVSKIAAEARRQSVQIIADATDGSVADTQATLDAARAQANSEPMVSTRKARKRSLKSNPLPQAERTKP
jgi:vacuolar-type H+-ATPase subunit H